MLEIEKSIAISILEDINGDLNYDNWKKAHKTVKTYIKNIELTQNEKLKKMIKKHIKYREQYGENALRTIILSKKIDKEINAIFSEK